MLNRQIRGDAIWYTSDLLDPLTCSVDTTDGKHALRICHAFSTRRGGVSREEYLSDMNFGLTLGEDPALTRENYRRLAAIAGIPYTHLLCADQTHTARVLTVGRAQRGMGLMRPSSALLSADDADAAVSGFDGFVTRESGVALSIRVADCVPILFCDPENAVIGACHAGWRGTLDGIACNTVSAMERLGANRGRVRAVIGHAVGLCCYVVDRAFRDRFTQKLGDTLCAQFFSEENGRILCDLRACNRLLLLSYGLLPQNIDTSTLCTCCHPDIFHSHRYAQAHQGGRRGLMACVISMEETEE
ncbi:MAG: peptidoglycan editing factor PgeF [Clostridia bacterium]|nr:peptidoglycan editing factor PgeF [Clostridia bacterium]